VGVRERGGGLRLWPRLWSLALAQALPEGESEDQVPTHENWGFIIISPTPLYSYKCSLFIGLNYHFTEFTTVPLNCYDTFQEYSSPSV